MGNNGSGKSSLLNILRRHLDPSDGEVNIPDGLRIGYVAQIIKDYDNLSGAQKFNKQLSAALALSPDILFMNSRVIMMIILMLLNSKRHLCTKNCQYYSAKRKTPMKI